jgi:glycosyltransferase involved in cell wall biosynthesis
MTVAQSRFVVLVKSALSRGYVASLEATVGGALDIVDINVLQALGPVRAIARLRNLRPERLIVPIEDASAYYILPILQVLAAATSSGALFLATPDAQLEQFTRLSVLPKLAEFIGSSAANLLSALVCGLKLAYLRGKARIPYRRPAARRALYINGNLWFGLKAGGSIGHVAGVINSLLRRGYEVHSAACGRAGLLDESAVHVELVPQRVFGFPVELNSYRYHQRMLPVLSAHAKRTEPSFIYQRLSLANFAGVELSRRFKVPLVTEYNGSEVWVQQHWGRPLSYQKLALEAESAMLRHSHLIVTISEVLRQELIARGVPQRRIVMYPNCIDPSVFDPARFSQAEIAALRARHGIPEGAILATFIGTFGRWHGVDVLALAIRKMLEEQPEFLAKARMHFLLVGDGMKMSQVRATLDHPLAARYVTFTGLVPQREAPSYLAAADVLLSPHVKNPDGTPFFGSPTKLFEYMAMGKPIIASDLDQIGEVLSNSIRTSQLPSNSPSADDARIALLCEPGNVDDLVLAVRFLAENPAWRASLGANVRSEALSRYTWDRHVDAILAGLSEVAEIETSVSPTPAARLCEPDR